MHIIIELIRVISTSNSSQSSVPSKTVFVVHMFVLAFYKNSAHIRGCNRFLSTFFGRFNVTETLQLHFLTGWELSRNIDAAYLIYTQLSSNRFDYSICWRTKNKRRTNFPLQFPCIRIQVHFLNAKNKTNKQSLKSTMTDNKMRNFSLMHLLHFHYISLCVCVHCSRRFFRGQF